MSSTTFTLVPSRRGRLAPAALLASLVMALLAGFTMLSAAPAAAHDVLISSDPVDGAVLETSPAQITLTFNNDLSTLGGQVLVTDEAGETISSGAPAIEGTTAAIGLPDALDNGTYSVAWRAVSSDSHPIEGTFTFTVADPAATAPEAPADEAAVPTATEEAEAEAEAEAEEQPVPISATDQDTEAAASESTDSGSDVPWTGIIVFAILGLAAGVVLTVVSKRRARKD